MQKPIIQLLVWLRVPGDTIFSVGALALAWFVLRLWIAPKQGTPSRRRAARRSSASGRVHMSTPLAPASLSAMGVRMLAAAPHRLLFFVGASNVLLAMTWWALWLIDARWHVIGMAQPASGRLAARDDHAVPGAAGIHVRLSADGVSAMDEPAGADPRALRARRRGAARRSALHAGGIVRWPAAAEARRGAHGNLVGGRHDVPGAPGASRPGTNLARGQLRVRTGFRFARAAVVHPVPAWFGSALCCSPRSRSAASRCCCPSTSRCAIA